MSTTTISPTSKINHPYIERKPGVCGGKPVIVGTRITVTQVAIGYERLGWTADQIIDAHPHLTLAQVHDALSCYYENQAAMDADILADEQFVAELKQQYPSKLP
jgi:uncharacterized protein (DUF433 family)